MKKIAFLLLSAILLFNSCEEDRLDTFSSENNIYFSLQKWNVDDRGNALKYEMSFPYGGKIYTQEWTGIRNSQDSILKSYMFEDPEQKFDTIFVPISVMGTLADHDRTVSYSIDYTTSSPDAKDVFKVLDAFIPANQNIGAIPVEVNRKNLGLDAIRHIDLSLNPNENFQTNYKTYPRSRNEVENYADMLRFRLVVSDGVQEPASWFILANWFGPFSRKKLILMCDMGANMEDFYMLPNPPIIVVMSYGSALARYLKVQKSLGNTIYEEDGVTEMTAGPIYNN